MKKNYGFKDLVALMARLRGPGGCPWDRKQTHKSLLKYLREESREVADAINKGDPDDVCEELGDLLLQILFHAQIAAEKRRFTLADVVDGLAKKLVRRHPHVFGGLKLKTAADVVANWDDIKKKEKELRWKEKQAARRRA
ncbi:MAG: MazG family protein [Elusimicrobia bacterium]|jgi:tetrapyrrole methylase family protein/MazG family protein|nr:MazG family protein [Elusimicrobiota bacterium]MBK7207667.1 MazG family protein [Elusimicrobiota bacterium]MBK7544427.1 MazG family protein [Elusimicrobiota bacterium]MBK7573949.1 MazG family protein [Elusimicrobiota bacterium]MBK7689101.1 MazG family protein [Elusimicrobiota bacterium]